MKKLIGQICRALRDNPFTWLFLFISMLFYYRLNCTFSWAACVGASAGFVVFNIWMGLLTQRLYERRGR